MYHVSICIMQLGSIPGGGVRKSKSFCVELQLCFLVTLETPHQGARNLNASGGYIASLGNTAMASVLSNGKKPQLGRGSVYVYIYIYQYACKKDVLEVGHVTFLERKHIPLTRYF